MRTNSTLGNNARAVTRWTETNSQKHCANDIVLVIRDALPTYTGYRPRALYATHGMSIGLTQVRHKQTNLPQFSSDFHWNSLASVLLFHLYRVRTNWNRGTIWGRHICKMAGDWKWLPFIAARKFVVIETLRKNGGFEAQEKLGEVCCQLQCAS